MHEVLTIRITPELKRKLGEKSRMLGESLEALVNRLLEEYLAEGERKRG